VYHQYPQPWLQFGEERPRIPLILLAQQQQQLLEERRAQEEYEQEQHLQEQEEYAQLPPSRRPLTPITEERTSKMSLYRSSTFTSYGRTIGGYIDFSATLMLTRPLERYESSSQVDTIKDPNGIPVSPSTSAILQLVQIESAPSNRSDTAAFSSTPQQPQRSVETLPSLNKIPDIPDSNSKTSLQQPQAEVKPKKSKLSALALSKASSVVSQSESSTSTGTFRTGSVRTYPGLRPTAQSLAPPSTVAQSFPDDQSSVMLSSASSHVRRAIQTALDQEAHDRDAAKNRPLPLTPPSSRAPSSVVSKSEVPKSESSFNSSNKVPQKLSKLAMLAQTRAGKPEPPRASNPPLIRTDPPKVAEGPASPLNKEPQQLSKLAMLAQAKIDPSKKPKLPKTTTEYLIPIANGSTATTAITTSYQSLYSLTDPSHSSVLPKLNLVPLAADSSMDLSSPSRRSTKLAMKIRKAHERQHAEVSRESEDILVAVPPMFEPKSIDSRALPSEFASLLISEEQLQYVGRPRNGRRHKEMKSDATSDTRRRKHQMHTPPHIIQASSAFDGPSPDDLVLNARRGTSLGKTMTPTSATSRGLAVPEKP
jgi:hypothetical protein